MGQAHSLPITSHFSHYSLPSPCPSMAPSADGRAISPGRAECRHGGVTVLSLARCHDPSHRARALLHSPGRTAAVEICKRPGRPVGAGDGALGRPPHPVGLGAILSGVAKPTGNRRLDQSAILSRRPPARFFASVRDCAAQPLVQYCNSRRTRSPRRMSTAELSFLVG